MKAIHGGDRVPAQPHPPAAERVEATTAPSGEGDVAPVAGAVLVLGWLQRHWFWPCAALVAVAAFVLRVARIGDAGFNSDEAVYAGQAASISGDPLMLQFFPVFRAHPLLLQSTLAAVYEITGVRDDVGRLTVAVFGLATVLACYLLGATLFGRGVGLLAAAIIAVMPYHVLVSRQVLLDAPQALFNTLSLWAVARFTTTRREGWLYVAAGMLALSVLAKETSVILLGSFFVYFALVPQRLRIRTVLGSGVLFAAVVATYPLSLRMAGAGRTGGAFISYQLFRRPNHSLTFYLTVVPPALGLLVVTAALVGLWAFRRGWEDALLWVFVVVPVMFFGLFPVKGYQYLLPIAPPMAVLAARTLLRWPAADRQWPRRWPRGAVRAGFAARAGAIRTALIVITLASLAIPAWQTIQPSDRPTFLAGTGGIPRGRELGAWIDDNTPQGITIMTLGPSMANIIQWYGHREARGLSVSPNPLYRNPVYDPLPNPDLSIRRNQVQYIVWDSFSADRSPHFSETLMRYVERYRGHEVHRETVRRRNDRGELVDVPVMIVYEVRPL